MRRLAGAGGAAAASGGTGGRAAGFTRRRPGLFRAAACLVLAAAALLALPAGVSAQAQNEVRSTWALTPSGLADGDQFRLIFISSTGRTGNAASSDIEVYNTFVQGLVAAGHSAIQAYSSQFRVVGSTAAVDARDNTDTTGTGVPIYWLNGRKVANNYADFYDGSWSNEANPKSESGNNINTGFLPLFTGSEDDGTESFDTGGLSVAIGRSSVRSGRLNLATASPLSGGLGSGSNSGRFYGLSPVFTVKGGPAITDVSVTSRPADGTDTFKAGERVEVTFTFDEAVEVQNAGSNGANVNAYIAMNETNSAVISWQANFLRMDHPRKLVFGLTVTSSHVDVDGLCIGFSCIGERTIRLSGGGAIVAVADGAAAARNYDAVQTSWKVDGDTAGLTGGVCDRQPAVRDAIVGKVTAASTCAAVTDAQVNAIGSLDLSGEGIGALRKSDFEGLTSLQTLDLSGNALDHLPGDLFEHLDASMRTLKLNGNPLGALPAGVFDGLTGIRTLDLANTGLTELPAGLFADLNRLETLRLVENRLRAFPAAALADVAGTLEDLFMRDNDIASIAAGDLDGMTELQRLALSDNALTSLPAGLFDDATELYELKLDNNALASLPDDLLRPLTKLQTVSLEGNPGFDSFAPVVEPIPAQSIERGARVDLEAVPGASPWGDNVTWSWTQTDSSGTTVTLDDADTATPSFDAPSPNNERVLAFEATARGRGTSGAGASEGTRTAEVTVPGRASIVDVSVTSRPLDGTDTFKRGDHIEVTFTYSEPVQVNRPVVSAVVAINLAFSGETPIANYHRRDHPSKLIFRYVVIRGDTDPDGFRITGPIALVNSGTITAVSDGADARPGFPSQNTTWNVDGRTRTLTGGICADGYHPEVLKAIVRAVPQAADCSEITSSDLAQIDSLDVSGEDVGSLHKRDFEGLTGLLTLDLSGNDLDHLPSDLFDHVATLTELKLNGNDIAALPANVFDRLTALTELELHGNDIAVLPGNVFNRLTALQALDLRANELTTLPPGVFDRLTELRRLRFSNNELATLPDNVFEPLTKLISGGLWLSNNRGFGTFAPAVTVARPAQTATPGERVDLEATAGPSPWGANLQWSWSQTDTSGVTATLVDGNTRSAHFVAPAPVLETELGFQATATGRGTAGVGSPSRGTADATVTVEDTTPPELVSAEVGGSGGLLTLTFNEDLDITATKLPPADAFTVKADGVEVAVGGVVAGSQIDQVLLGLPSAAISQDQIVTVSYAVPGTDKVIEDIEGNDAPPFTDVRVTNNSTLANTAPPVPRRAEVLTTGTTLALTFNEDLDLTGLKLPPASAFTITADGVDVEVRVVSTGLGDVNRVVNLQVAAGAIGQRQIVTVSYTAPTDGSEVIEDVDGNDALSFTDFPVVNNSTVFVMDATGTPTISGVAQVGNALRADTSDIEDDDGLPAAFTYEWVRVAPGGLGTPVGTNSSSYTVSSADVGSTIRVDVSFIDGRGNPEGPLPSDAVPAVAAAGTCPAGSDWRATLTMGYDSVEVSSTRNHNFGFGSGGTFGALVPATIPYATGYTVTRISRVLSTSLDGSTTLTDTLSFAVTGGDLPDGTVLNLGATALTVGTDTDTTTAGWELWDLRTLGLSPTWVGGQELAVCANLAPVLESAKADGTSLVLTYAEDLDTGSTPAASAYAVTVDGTAAAPSSVSVSGRTVTLTLAAAVTGGEAVTLEYTPGSNPVQDESGLDAPGFANRTVVVNNDATGTPTIGGVAQVGGMLTANVSAIGDTDGLPAAFDYRWVRVAPGGRQTDIGTNSSRYSPTFADVGRTIRVDVRFIDGAGNAEGPLASVAVGPVAAPTTIGTCPADSDWSAKLTMGYAFSETSLSRTQDFGFNSSANFGALDPATIPYATGYTVTQLSRALSTSLDGSTTLTDNLSFEVTGGDLPDGTVLNLGATALTVGTDTDTTIAGQEQWNLKALGLSPTWAEDQELTVCANLAPVLESAKADGTSLVLTYAEDLDTSSVPLPGAYSVRVAGGAGPAVSSVSVSGTTVTLTLAAAVTAGPAVTVTYTPGSNPVQDESGLDALPLTGQEVVIVDTTPPIPASAEVPASGASLTLTFNENLDIGPGKLPPADAFTVKADDFEVTVQSVGEGTGADNFILVLSSTIKQGQTVTVDYAVLATNPIQDTAGNDAMGFTDFAVDNNSTVEGTPPVPASAEVRRTGNTLSLTFNEDLDVGPGKFPPADAFIVKADGVAVAVDAVFVGEGLDNLILSLPAAAIEQGQIVTVSYAVPTTNPIRDVAGNEAKAFEDFPVTNNSTVDETPPVPASGEVPASGASLTLTFNEDLDNGSDKLPPATAFTVTANGVDVPVQSVTAGSGADSFVLDLGADAIKQGQTVTVDYAVPTTGLRIADTAGNEAVGFTDFEVDNNSIVDGTPPVPASAEVPGASSTLNLTFNEDLDIGQLTVPPASAFTVKADGVAVAVDAVFIGGGLDKLILSLPTAAIGARQIVTVSYAVPTTGTVIEDTAGNEALAFTDFPVTNNSTVANSTPPVPASAEVPASGASLTLTFNEDLDNGPDKLPPASAFTVTANGVDVTVQSVTAGSGADGLVLDLGADAINQCQTVTVSYAVPATNPIQDTDDIAAVGFTGFAVDNNSMVECPNLYSPVFGGDDPRMFSVEENVPLGTNVGVPVTATDADRDTVTYSLDTTTPYASYFQIDSATGQLQTNVATGHVFNHEMPIHVYAIGVIADDGREGTDTAQITVVVSVTDVNEPPGAPVDLTVTGSGTTSLLVTWTAPPNEGRPDILHYDVQYREVGASWMNGPQDVIGTSATIAPVDPAKSYEVRVRATNDEGDGPWAVWSADNSPATGKPAIGGTPQVDQTLTAGMGTIADADNLPTTTFPTGYSFQWVRVATGGTETDVGTDSTYTVLAADVGSTIRVDVSFTDGGGRGETVPSDAVGPVVAAEPQACVLGGDVWCAILVVRDLGSGQRGCTNSLSGNRCTNTSTLTEDEFTHDMTPYAVTTVQVRTDGELRLWFSRNLTAETGSLVLVVGSERFPFAGATVKNVDNRRWDSSGLSWSIGDSVELRLVEGFPPLAPAAPGVNGVDDNDTSLKVTWGAPDNAGRPPIAHYDLRYRVVGTSGWREWPDDETGPNVTIGSLTTGTQYDVQVRASNADGDSPWSPSGQGTTGVVETVETIPNGKLRLVVDNDETISTTGGGRLEVYFKRKGESGWGTVCDDRFTSAFDDPNDDLEPDATTDAKVPNVAAQFACQLMGKATGEMVPPPAGMSVLPDGGTTPIWLDDVRCAGTVGDDGFLVMANHWREGKSATKLNHCYHAGVGLHNCDHSEDVYLQCTGTLEPESAAQEEAAAPLTASFEDLPETHDGETPFTFRLSLSEDIANGDVDVRDSAFEVSGGSVTGASRVDGRSDLWEITVTPDGTGNIGIVLAANRECGTAGALCTADGRMLTTAWLGSVAAQPGTGTGTTSTDEEGAAPLTAQFAAMPAEHDGESKFRFRLVFSDEIFEGTEPFDKNKAVRDALDITGGVAKGSRRVDKTEFDEFWIDVRPSGNGPVTISLSPASSCSTSSVTCTPDGRKLSAAIGARVEGPAGLSVADANVLEGPGAALAFAVTLDRSTSAAVHVDYATRDGSAQAGSDYTAASGTLSFAPGETAKTVTVAVLDDSHDEGSETLTLVLSNPSGAYLADGEATGTIENSGLMPQAWLSRFGRTVAEQVLDAVEERIRSAPQAGVQVTVAGQRIGAAAPSEEEAQEAEAQASLEDFSTWLRSEAEDREKRTGSRSVAPRELLTGSSFALTTGADGTGGGQASLWGRGAVSSFDGREGELSLSGEVTGALLGADWTRERWTTGLMLSHARGEGSYRGAGSGEVSSTVTGLYPYGRYAVTDRVTVWGAAGYGAGTLTLTPEDHEALKTDMDLMMAAAGLRGTVVEAPPEGGPELAVKTDAMAVRTSSEATGGGAGGNLAAAEADVTRLRLGLEGTWRGLEIGTGTLVPRLEIGVRHDGGDAETGFGLDLGGGLAWSDPGTGIRAEVSGRGLLTHESAGFRERGIAGRLGWDPTPGSDRGPSLTLSQTMGLSAQGGADALLGRTTLAGLAANDNGDEFERRRLELRLGYGLGAFGDGFTATPEAGFGMSAGLRDYSLAWRFVRDRRRGDIGSLEFSVETRRRESANDDTPPEHTMGLRLTARW